VAPPLHSLPILRLAQPPCLLCSLVQCFSQALGPPMKVNEEQNNHIYMFKIFICIGFSIPVLFSLVKIEFNNLRLGLGLCVRRVYIYLSTYKQMCILFLLLVILFQKTIFTAVGNWANKRTRPITFTCKGSKPIHIPSSIVPHVA
jgi:hypothetical protein